MSTQLNQWRVNSAEGIFETDLETLKAWIADGRVLPTDMISKGNLNPIEARRVPALRSVFSGETDAAHVSEMPAPTTSAMPQDPPSTEPGTFQDSAQFDSEPDSSSEPIGATPPSNVCHNHPELAAHHICRLCGATFCEQCPRFVDWSDLPFCPLCGDHCDPFEQQAAPVEPQQSLGVGFGAGDFVRALRYPFNHKFVFLFGALVYGLLLLGGFWGRLTAYVVMFGCMSHIITQVAWGRMDRSFMPDFSEFSLWDDLAVPVGLGIGITIVTWGPMIVLVLALIFGFGASTRSRLAEANEADSQSSALTHEDLATLADPNADGKKLEEANKKLNQLRPGHEISQEAEKTSERNNAMADWRVLSAVLGISALVIVLGLISLAWAIFYYPMALAVAGYTESFSAVVNPLVGIDTIKRMGATYFKALGMVLGIEAVGLSVAVIVAAITAPFALPFVGNLPARFLDGGFSFYFNLVIACVLGLALYKCSDRLGING